MNMLHSKLMSEIVRGNRVNSTEFFLFLYVFFLYINVHKSTRDIIETNIKILKRERERKKKSRLILSKFFKKRKGKVDNDQSSTRCQFYVSSSINLFKYIIFFYKFWDF